jgi:hypothetical protein
MVLTVDLILCLVCKKIVIVSNRAGGSVDTEMDRLHLHVDTPCAKSASKKSVFGSLERSMDRLLCMLTPKKKRSSPSFDQPRTVKVIDDKFFKFIGMMHIDLLNCKELL